MLKIKHKQTEQVVEQEDMAGIEAFLSQVEDADEWEVLPQDEE